MNIRKLAAIAALAALPFATSACAGEDASAPTTPASSTSGTTTGGPTASASPSSALAKGNPVARLRAIKGCKLDPGAKRGEYDIDGNLVASCNFMNNGGGPGTEVTLHEIVNETNTSSLIPMADDSTHVIIGDSWFAVISAPDWYDTPVSVDEVAKVLGGKVDDSNAVLANEGVEPVEEPTPLTGTGTDSYTKSAADLTPDEFAALSPAEQERALRELSAIAEAEVEGMSADW